ncbi:VIT1/CCC1 transporter family protein [Thermomicrobium sp. CFH 73360]|uniref:VIT1/CCC1 transporter family protein n=1 Tax=Thermomicrobium sp. CFH 73360 TaxID=2951987 RepID=UPI00207753BD|nr:VIT1/CCC1 transporter family protein [Thermomicrobium sp. CFH 73360]MCM8747087.1 VIT1/CCC1 transporter family protein [Thermomicrobium sp. CFH 73360]
MTRWVDNGELWTADRPWWACLPLQHSRFDERGFVLQVVQPGLLGLMDGSVSTLAPIFTSAFATNLSRVAFLVGLSASIGAVISMGFAEALSDTGELTGRGGPIQRGLITAVSTFLGGILHSLPFLIPHVHHALSFAYVVVGVELVVIAWIRYRVFQMPLTKSIVQVVLGGVLVFATGVALGYA